jgi:hypothetical protein
MSDMGVVLLDDGTTLQGLYGKAALDAAIT